VTDIRKGLNARKQANRIQSTYPCQWRSEVNGARNSRTEKGKTEREERQKIKYVHGRNTG
jgi:hypothetical protein